MTLIFDKGNNSEENINKFSDNDCFNFVGSVKVDDHKDLSTISNRSKLLIKQLPPSLEGVKAYRTKKKIYGKIDCKQVQHHIHHDREARLILHQ
ncbi:MAG: hypothetical protein OMM_09665 [Candidatus Magnetoglobus multicellularis str. Araruama]|uniref:Transposase IS4-like domain-containing protein n=1 Tax=Candidatus Magnetoglobus multicellularis str. Araruama TaxID=890399 RepID=A0A1V1P3I7_9BACT|nr:MAG: hypothetical protein OMM_09665 [Candidatus Magnetoglobus multicellularis str. Araruama]